MLAIYELFEKRNIQKYQYSYGVVLRGNPFLLAGIIVQSRNDYTINTPLPKPLKFATRGTLPRKNVKKIV